MRVTQKISIGELHINSMANTSILQIGASGAMKARSEDIKEYVPSQQAADQKLENKITKEVSPPLKEQGLPVEPYDPKDIAQQQGQSDQGQTGQAGQPSQRKKRT